jgi:hypothetical protein
MLCANVGHLARSRFTMIEEEQCVETDHDCEQYGGNPKPTPKLGCQRGSPERLPPSPQPV